LVCQFYKSYPLRLDIGFPLSLSLGFGFRVVVFSFGLVTVFVFAFVFAFVSAFFFDFVFVLVSELVGSEPSEVGVAFEFYGPEPIRSVHMGYRWWVYLAMWGLFNFWLKPSMQAKVRSTTLAYFSKSLNDIILKRSAYQVVSHCFYSVFVFFRLLVVSELGGNNPSEVWGLGSFGFSFTFGLRVLQFKWFSMLAVTVVCSPPGFFSFGLVIVSVSVSVFVFVFVFIFELGGSKPSEVGVAFEFYGPQPIWLVDMGYR
jgi:hypothetical protein